MLALLVAACFALAWVLRLGWIADYFSRPVLIGYIHGVAVVLIIGQLGKLLGLSIDAREPLAQLWEVLSELGERRAARRSPWARSRSRCCSALRFLMPRLPGGAARRRRRDRASRGRSICRRTGSPWSARCPRGCRASSCRAPPGDDVARSCVPAALGIFLVSFADEILTARSFAGKHNQHVRASQELLAMGAANAAAGFTQGFSIGASGSRTAVNDGMGARSQIAGLDRRRDRARDPALPHRAGAVPAQAPCSGR